MNMTVMSTKGQVVLPKQVREMLGLEPGVSLEVRVSGDEIVLKRASKAKSRSIMDLKGCLKDHYSGPPITIEQMNEAGPAMASERYLRAIARENP